MTVTSGYAGADPAFPRSEEAETERSPGSDRAAGRSVVVQRAAIAVQVGVSVDKLPAWRDRFAPQGVCGLTERFRTGRPACLPGACRASEDARMSATGARANPCPMANVPPAKVAAACNRAGLAILATAKFSKGVVTRHYWLGLDRRLWCASDARRAHMPHLASKVARGFYPQTASPGAPKVNNLPSPRRHVR